MAPMPKSRTRRAVAAKRRRERSTTRYQFSPALAAMTYAERAAFIATIEDPDEREVMTAFNEFVAARERARAL